MSKFRVLLLLAAVMLEVGCGLPDSYYLYPPSSTQQASLGSNVFIFSNPVHDLNHDINVTFSGDELYYKFYSDPSQITGSDYDSSNSADASTQLTNKGFYPLCLGSDPVGSRTDPVVAIGSSLAASGSTVTVSINQNTAQVGSSYFVINGGSNIEIRRDVPDQISLLGYYKVFQRNLDTPSDFSYASGDPDISSVFSALGSQIYIAWYAISFGYTLTSTPVRSIPAYLGYMSIPYP